MRIACTGLAGRIMSGRVNKAGDAFIGSPKDVTSDVLKAVIDKLEHHGGNFEVTCNGAAVATLSLIKGPETQAAEKASGWVAVKDGLPDVKEGEDRELMVCVRRARNGKSYVFAARYLNQYPLHSEGHPDSDEEGMFLATGWHDVKESADYDGWYSPLIDVEGDEVTHWAELLPLPEGSA